jgi:small subunit ribosomal protein S2
MAKKYTLVDEQKLLKELLESGAHFGHRTRYWNPKMAPYIYGVRNGIHIINLDFTVKQMVEALNAVYNLVREGGRVLFVATKYQADDIIKAEAERCGMPFVTSRWLGGMLTNFSTVSNSLKKLATKRAELEAAEQNSLSKKQVIDLTRSIERLERDIGGIKDMPKLPNMLFVLDVNLNNIAVTEANKLGIPVVAVLDTNSSPEGVNYPIVGNDDSEKSVAVYARYLADAILAARAETEINNGRSE